jgi:hypothetical protein
MTVVEGSSVQPSSSSSAAGSMDTIWQRFTPTVCSVLFVFIFLYYVDVAYVVSLRQLVQSHVAACHAYFHAL